MSGSDRANNVEETSSEAEPHRMRHRVIKPVIQEVTEFIQPYRHHIQHIQPMIEDIRTVVSEKSHSNDRPIMPNDPGPVGQTDTENNHNDIDNGFDSGFQIQRPLEDNERQQNFDLRPNKNQMNLEYNSGNEQKVEQQLESGSAFSESKWRRTYRLLPIVISNSELPIRTSNTFNENLIHQKVMEIFKFLNFWLVSDKHASFNGLTGTDTRSATNRVTNLNNLHNYW